MESFDTNAALVHDLTCYKLRPDCALLHPVMQVISSTIRANVVFLELVNPRATVADSGGNAHLSKAECALRVDQPTPHP